MQKYLLAFFATVALSVSAQIPYKVIVPVPDQPDGTTAYMINFDTREVVDSAVVADQKALFKGDVDEPYMVSFTAADKDYGTSVLEQGTSTINQELGAGVGTMLNDRLKALLDQVVSISKAFQNANPQKQDSLVAAYNNALLSAIEDNADNAVGYYVFLQYAPQIEASEVLALVDKYPDLKKYNRVENLLDKINKKLATAPGQKFVDFEVTYDGVTRRLSDYVGKGDYVLVDFWASWCGPCMREIQTLKDIYKEYSDKGLKVLGVAVWDEPEASLAKIKEKNIPWECIIDAKSIPTDLYGINGIPCIILFGPDGTILSRDLQGQELKKSVADNFKVQQ